MKILKLIICFTLFYAGVSAQLMLFNNGPMINKPGSGAGGANVSSLHNNMTIFGLNHAVSQGYKVAEDFKVPAAGWTIDSIVFFAYQTKAAPSTSSTINEVKIGIWNGSPAVGTATIIYGDTALNTLDTSLWSGIYRTNGVDTLNALRPIMRNVVATPGLTLAGGSYYVSWQTGGSLASGPWAPLITLDVITETGNAIQYDPALLAWQPAKDTSVTTGLGTGDIQGFPFIIYGHQGTAGSGELNDSCANAIDLSASIGQPAGVVQTTGPYNNDSAGTGLDDPATGFACFGEPDGTGSAPSLDNTLWFSFVGDGGLYFIETGNCGGITNYIDNGNTQIGIYQGACGALIPLACNENGPGASTTTFPAGLNFLTVAGTTYYLLIDGFNANGTISTGNFCVNITKLQSTVGIEEPANANHLGLINIYPIPVKNNLQFTYNSHVFESVLISITDNLGRTVISNESKAIMGINSFAFEVSQLRAGLYYVQVKGGAETPVARFVKE